MSLEALFQSGSIADVVLAVMACEALLLARYVRRLPVIVGALGAGACLVLALRAALLQQGWPVIATCLVLSFMFHAFEVQQWLRQARP